jgi:DNA-binding transcriptional LysR family regulator
VPQGICFALDQGEVVSLQASSSLMRQSALGSPPDERQIKWQAGSVGSRQRLLLDRSHMSVDAAVSGVGVALESTLMMSAELSSGSLVCPIEDPPPIQVTSQWILYSPGRMRHEKVRLFLDWLKREREE